MEHWKNNGFRIHYFGIELVNEFDMGGYKKKRETKFWHDDIHE